MFHVNNFLLGFSIKFQSSNSRKLYFMIFERGPRAFIYGTVQLVQECIADGPSVHHLCQSASAYISERLDVLTTLRRVLATFLAEVCSILFSVSFHLCISVLIMFVHLFRFLLAFVLPLHQQS